IILWHVLRFPEKEGALFLALDQDMVIHELAGTVLKTSESLSIQTWRTACRTDDIGFSRYGITIYHRALTGIDIEIYDSIPADARFFVDFFAKRFRDAGEER